MERWTAFLSLALAGMVFDSAGTTSICQVTSVTLDTESSPFYLHSPPNPDTLKDTDNCTVSIHSGPGRVTQLDVTFFDLSGRDPCGRYEEHLTISFGLIPWFAVQGRGDVDTIRWCGQTYSQRLETRDIVELTYFGGVLEDRGRGFNVTLTSVERYGCGGGTMMVGGTPTFIYSPGYPSPYDDNINECMWEVQSVHGRPIIVDSERFFMEYHASCNYDYLMITDSNMSKKYCGDQRLQFTSRRDRLRLTLHTDHTENKDGFVLRLVESPPDNTTCNMQVTAGSSPVLLQLPQLASGFNSINCWWLVEAGGPDSVVMLEMKQFHTTAQCSEFEARIYDGRDPQAPRILSSCAPQQMFQNVRSSGRYMYLDFDLSGFGGTVIDVTFTVTSGSKALPRVMYASFAKSYVFTDINSIMIGDLGFLVRGSEDDVGNYSTCVEATVKGSLQTSQSLVISDYFLMFSGYNESYAELGTACGDRVKQRVISRGSKVFFKRTSFTAVRQVWLLFSLQRYCQPDLVTLQSTFESPQMLRSDYSSNRVTYKFDTITMYPNNAYCRWLIQPAQSMYYTQVKVLTSSLFEYGCYDNVTVYDYDVQTASRGSNHLLTWCADDTPVILSSKGRALLLEFKTNEKNRRYGFKLNYSSVSLINECPSMATLVAEERVQYLSSPNYPHNYPNNVDCQWRITSESSTIKVTLLSVSIAQEMPQCAQYDFLVIYDGWDSSGTILADLCGGGFIQPTLLSSGVFMLIRFRSDHANTASGFRLQYQTTNLPSTWQCNREVLVTETEDRTISSPYYPNPYPRDTDCYWKIQAFVTHVVMLEVLDLSVPCTSPVLIYDGPDDNSLLLARLCSSEYNNPYVSTQKHMYVRFSTETSLSQNVQPGTGFRFRLRSWQGSGACRGEVEHLMAYPTKRYITSPQYPADYPPGSDCRWRVESAYRNMTLRLEVEDARLEWSVTCSFDSVSVYDGYGDGSRRIGKICGEPMAVYWSSGLYLYIHFVSDSVTQYKGFSLAYQAVATHPPATPSPEDSSSDSVGVVVGATMGGVVFLLTAVTLFLCFLGRCQRRQDTTSASSRPPRQGDPNSTVLVVSPVIVNQMAPPPYPGVSNAGYMSDDLPPAYTYQGHSTCLPPPPLYEDMDVPPPYTDTMMDSNPPPTPTDPVAPDNGLHLQRVAMGTRKEGERLAEGRGRQMNGSEGATTPPSRPPPSGAAPSSEGDYLFMSTASAGNAPPTVPHHRHRQPPHRQQLHHQQQQQQQSAAPTPPRALRGRSDRDRQAGAVSRDRTIDHDMSKTGSVNHDTRMDRDVPTTSTRQDNSASSQREAVSLDRHRESASYDRRVQDNSVDRDRQRESADRDRQRESADRDRQRESADRDSCAGPAGEDTAISYTPSLERMMSTVV